MREEPKYRRLKLKHDERRVVQVEKNIHLWPAEMEIVLASGESIRIVGPTKLFDQIERLLVSEQE